MPKNLLVADDSITIQKVVGITFASEDFQVTAVDNGDGCHRPRARAEAGPDPRGRRDAAKERLRGLRGHQGRSGASRHIPVLLLAGTFEAFDEARARAAHADGHIAKPFESQALLNKVRELLDRRRRSRRRPGAAHLPRSPVAPAASRRAGASRPPAVGRAGAHRLPRAPRPPARRAPPRRPGGRPGAARLALAQLVPPVPPSPSRARPAGDAGLPAASWRSAAARVSASLGATLRPPTRGPPAAVRSAPDMPGAATASAGRA